MAKINGNEIRPGYVIEHDGGLWVAVKTNTVKPGKGGAYNQVELKNLINGTKLNERFRSAETVEQIRLDLKDFSFLYAQDDALVFMDTQSYEQLAIPEDQVAESLKWIVPNEEVELLYIDEAPSDVQVPSAVELTVTETQPGVKGDTASGGGDKPATLESGVVVRVPLFVNEGDRVRVDTRSGAYVSRA